MTDNPNCPFCGRLPEKAARRNAIIGTHPGLVCRTEGCIAEDVWFDNDYRYAIRPAEDALTAYADKLAAGLPEGMLPKDVETLREANAKLAQVVHELREAAKWVSECWGKSDQEWYRPDMDDAMEKLNELLPKGTDDGKIN